MNEKKLYIVALIFGFLSCWTLFKLPALPHLYSAIFDVCSYRGIAHFALFCLFLLTFSTLYGMLSGFFDEEKKQKQIKVGCIAGFFVSCVLSYVALEHIVSPDNWKKVVINELNYLLYIFAWYSLIKAFKVWRNYGNFYELMLSGKIKNYALAVIFSLFVADLLIFNFTSTTSTSAMGILFISLTFLFIICFVNIIIVSKSKTLIQHIEKLKAETDKRIAEKDTPKEVSLAYDQISLLVLFSVIAKRVFDPTKAVDFPFVASKLFKIVCYQISLMTTCFFTKQKKEIAKSLAFMLIIGTTLMVIANCNSLRNAILSNATVEGTINFILDFFLLPFGTIKVFTQIITILQAKRAKSISTGYFSIATFFSIITSLNLIAKGKFYDRTITMQLYKSCLYISVLVLCHLFNQIEKRRANKIK